MTTKVLNDPADLARMADHIESVAARVRQGEIRGFMMAAIGDDGLTVLTGLNVVSDSLKMIHCLAEKALKCCDDPHCSTAMAGTVIKAVTMAVGGFALEQGGEIPKPKPRFDA